MSVYLGPETMKQQTEFKDLEDGQLAIVVEGDLNYAGRIIQKFGSDTVITIGKPEGNSWSSVCSFADCPLKVRILEPGETIIVKDN